MTFIDGAIEGAEWGAEWQRAQMGGTQDDLNWLSLERERLQANVDQAEGRIAELTAFIGGRTEWTLAGQLIFDAHMDGRTLHDVIETDIRVSDDWKRRAEAAAKVVDVARGSDDSMIRNAIAEYDALVKGANTDG